MHPSDTQAEPISTAQDYMAAYDFALRLISEIDGEQAIEAMHKISQFWRTPRAERLALANGGRS